MFENDNQTYNVNFSLDDILNKRIDTKIKIFLVILLTILLLVFAYFTQPIFSFKYISTFRFLIILFGLYLAIFLTKRKKLLITCVVLYFFTFVLGFVSSPIFHSQAYYELLGDVDEVVYEEQPPQIDTDNLVVVDKALATQLGDKVLGEDIGLGSQYDIGEYYLVTTPEDIVWVAPLEPRNFFKWFQNRDGSPGYIYVSATDINDIRLVRDIDGKDLKINYTNGAYFFDQIKRHLYVNGYVFNEKTDYSFEIDDEGNPYWVVTQYEPKIWYGGNDTTSVLVVDAQTGNIDKYDNVDDLPSWVERVQPEQFISEQINDYGLYKDGWLNSIFAQKNVIKQTDGNSYVYIDNEPFYYSGLTSIENDESTVGFMLVNLRTKESTFYKITGATETAAMSSAEGQVQQYGYDASFPILINQYDTPTYFMTLKDQDGLLKQYSYVSVKNYNIVGVGSSIDEAQKNYYEQLKTNNMTSNSTDDNTKSIDRINIVNDTYYLKFEDDDNIYEVSKDVSNELYLSEKGDIVNVEITDNKITSFDNITLNGALDE